ncbi:MAG TPA: hypothetical protein VIM13_04100, partial [Clostridia bacterium]
MGKIKELFRKKTAIIITAAVLLFAAAAATAALTGLFGSGKSTGTTAGADTGAGTQKDGLTDTIRYSELLDSIVEISPTDQDSLGVSTTSAFRLLFSRDTDEKAIVSTLSVEPKQ